MMAADPLHSVVYSIMPSGVSSRWPLPCRCACRVDAFAPHVAQHPAWLSHVQASCLERARPMAVGAFAGALAASSTVSPGRRRPERQRRAKAEGKIKGRGTSPLESPVCTWGWRGTRQGPAACCEGAPYRARMGKIACFVRRTATPLDGAAS